MTIMPRVRLASQRVLLLSLSVLAAVATVHAAFPPPQKYVSDNSHIIGAGTQQKLNDLLRAVENETTAEIAVVTVDSLDGMEVEEYANKLFKAWGIGKKGADNGVLVVVAPTLRKMRIEVGYGLEPILPDGLAGEIIRSEFTPAFKSGEYSRGIEDGVTRLAAIVRAKHVVTAEERKRFAEAAQNG